jgi:hypothetical protein
VRLFLRPHPDTPSPATEVEVEAVREGDRLRLGYRLRGDLARIRLPRPRPPRRSDGLWRHSCYEAFVRSEEDPAYYEFNLATSGEWAAYRLESYRSGMALAEVPEPGIEAAVADEVRVGVMLDLAALPELAGRPWRLGLAAVVEAADGSLSYWAITHPPGDPDFHHEAGFARRL